MTIETKLGRHFLAVWFIAFPPGAKMDLMGAVWRDEDGKMHAKYRHRYYNSPDPFDLSDKKSWYAMDFKQPPDMEEFKGIWEVLAHIGGGRLDWVEVEGNGDKLVEILREKPWAHMQRIQ